MKMQYWRVLLLAGAISAVLASLACAQDDKANETKKYTQNLPEQPTAIVSTVAYSPETKALIDELYALPSGLQVHQKTLDYLKGIAADRTVTSSELSGLYDLDHDGDRLTLKEEKAKGTDPLKPDYNIAKGLAYHDLNGSGTRENDEPVIPGLKLELLDEQGKKVIKAETGQDGIYSFNLLKGKYKLTIPSENAKGPNNQPFRYLNLSKSEFRPISSQLDLDVSDSFSRDYGLMQGFMTVTFPNDANWWINDYYDYDPKEGQALFWDGRKDYRRSQMVGSNHAAIDIAVSQKGANAYAPVPGKIVGTWKDPNGGYGVGIYTNDDFFVRVIHLSIDSNIQIGKQVSRGDLLGTIDFPREQHSHVEVTRAKGDRPIDLRNIIYESYDIFRPTAPVNCGFWTWPHMKFDPKFVSGTCSPGYWIKDNEPTSFK